MTKDYLDPWVEKVPAGAEDERRHGDALEAGVAGLLGIHKNFKPRIPVQILNPVPNHNF